MTPPQRANIPQLSAILFIAAGNPSLNSIQALRRQTLPRDEFELICICPSADRTISPLLREHLQTFDGSCQCLEQPALAAAAWNAGIRASRGSILLFLDADAEAPPDLLEQHLQQHRALAGEDSVVLGSVPLFREAANELFSSRACEASLPAITARLQQRDVHPVPYLLGSNVSLSRTHFVAGRAWFDEALGTPAWAGIEWCYRLWKSGVALQFCSAAQTALSSASAGQLCSALDNQESMTLFFQKHPELGFLAPVLPHIRQLLLDLCSAQDSPGQSRGT